MHFATNEYSWVTFYKRQGRDWFSNLEGSFRDLVKLGTTGFEPSVQKPGNVNLLAPLLWKHRIEKPSVYVGCTLHKEKEAGESLLQVRAIAKAAKPLDVKIILTNPNPILEDLLRVAMSNTKPKGTDKPEEEGK